MPCLMAVHFLFCMECDDAFNCLFCQYRYKDYDDDGDAMNLCAFGCMRILCLVSALAVLAV
jgi:hypothetical protein